jgi:hypothetical protein
MKEQQQQLEAAGMVHDEYIRQLLRMDYSTTEQE